MKGYENTWAAFKDPVTGKVYTGNSHNGIFEALEDMTVKRRMVAALTAQDNSLGFSDNGQFLTRAEMQAKHGFCQSHELANRKAEL